LASGITAKPVVVSRFALDGGAMHGVVPRVLWERLHPADARHRIRLVARCLVVDVAPAGARVLCDTGLGQAWDPTERDRYAIEEGSSIRGALADAGVDPDTVTHVLLTHLHWDHAGGILEPGGQLAFPKAEHVVGEAALGHALEAGPKDQGSFRHDTISALTERARLRVLPEEAPAEIVGVELRRSEGHTAGLLIPFLSARDDGPPLAFPTDLVPTRSHTRPAWVAAYDNEPARSVREKAALFSDLAACGGGVLLYHDPLVEAAWARGAGAELELRPGGVGGPS
jgi:glyoxylase-like metal-dependent hydrolase (beta-lactamase superfamily II)